jgi:serine/threonine protein kinase
MCDTDRQLRLNPSVEYLFQEPDVVTVKVKRGESLTRYSINRTIYDFLERFREPATLREVATRMEADGFDPERVLHFGKNIMKTPLVEFYNPDYEGTRSVVPLLLSLGYHMEAAFKHREFDGVFKVRDDTGRKLIIKILHTPDPSVAEVTRTRLQNEFRILKELEQVDGVMRADSFVDGRTPYLTAEFITGIRLHSSGARTLNTSLAMCAQVARIVREVHGHDIVHGDLHTSNMLRNDRDTVTLIDFDCSFFAHGDYRPRNGGAIHFLSPERVIGSWYERVTKEASKSSDVYQAAVAIYNILTGDMPYRGRTLSELATGIKSGRFRPLTTTGSGEPIPSEVVEFVHRALNPDPRVRPASMDEYPYAH